MKIIIIFTDRTLLLRFIRHLRGTPRRRQLPFSMPQPCAIARKNVFRVFRRRSPAMLIINVIALSLMAAGLLTGLRDAHSEHEHSDGLEHWLAIALLNAAALALWNIAADPRYAVLHWLLAFTALLIARLLLQTFARHAPALRPLHRLVPTAGAALSLLWLRGQWP
jgi:hypothetical protein